MAKYVTALEGLRDYLAVDIVPAEEVDWKAFAEPLKAQAQSLKP